MQTETQDSDTNVSIPEIMKSLKTSFRKIHFEKVQNILVHRESQLTDKIQQLIQQSDLLSHKLDVEKLKSSSLDVRLRKARGEIERWKTKYRNLASKVPGKSNARPTPKPKGIAMLNKNKDYGTFSMEVQTDKGVDMLTEDNATLTRGTITPTEDNATLTRGTITPTEDNATLTRGTITPTEDNATLTRGTITPTEGNATLTRGTNSENLSRGYAKLLTNDATAGDDNNDDCSPIKNLNGNRRTSQECRKGEQPLIVTNKSMLKRKCEITIYSSDSEDSSSSSDDEDGPNNISSTNKPWTSEVDLFFAVQKNAEVSMKAVCALYKQHRSSVKSVGGAFSSQTLGFKESYAHRGRILGEFLTDGDSEGKLTKSVGELRVYDPKALYECKNIAVEHYKQLFEMYEKNEYTFFP